MFVHEGHVIADAWYFVDETTDTCHMFYISWPIEEDGSKTPFVGHAITNDLFSWERLPPVLHQGPPGSWDDLRLCTGSIIKRDGRYWMAYSATSTNDSSLETIWAQHRIQRIGMAVSDDLLAWKKLAGNPTLESSSPYYEYMGTGQRKMVHWRDPYLFDDGHQVYQFISARSVLGEVEARGTVAIAVGTDMRNWAVLPPIEHDHISDEMECPQIYQIGSRWYLVFVTPGRSLTTSFARRFGKDVPQYTNYSMVSDHPLGPFRIHGTGQIVNHPIDTFFYAAQLVHFKNEWHLFATVHNEHISDPVPVYGDETGVHAINSPTIGAPLRGESISIDHSGKM